MITSASSPTVIPQPGAGNGKGERERERGQKLLSVKVVPGGHCSRVLGVLSGWNEEVGRQ